MWPKPQTTNLIILMLTSLSVLLAKTRCAEQALHLSLRAALWEAVVRQGVRQRRGIFLLCQLLLSVIKDVICVLLPSASREP